MAPEVVRREAYGTAADVYGFALVVYELITRGVPFDGWSADSVSALVALRGRRPQLPSDTPRPVEQLVHRCWCDAPRERYAFVDVQRALTQIRMQLTVEELAWLDQPDGHPMPSLTPL